MIRAWTVSRSTSILRGLVRPALAVSAAVLAGVSEALAQAAPLLCLPPEAPMTALPATVLTEYRAEISSEFEAYFGAVTDYITCLDTERTRALDEARAATEAYSTLLNTFPAARNTP
jgi:hypothetical protein